MLMVSAFGIAGCREPNRLDPASLARDLPEAVVPDHPEVVADVVCPGPIDRGIGIATTCAATIAGTAVTLRVTQVDENGGVRVDLDRKLLDVTKVAADLAARLTKDVGIATSVRSRTFDVTVVDDTGAIDLLLR